MPFNPERFTAPAAPESWTEENVIRETVADAMLKTQAYFVDRFLSGTMWKNRGRTPNEPGYFHPENYTLDHGLQMASEDECDKGCLLLVYNLMQSPHFQEQFQNALLLGSTGDFSGDKEWIYHMYALTQDRQGIWRAASPANHIRTDDPPVSPSTPHPKTHMTRILADTSLEEVLGAIQELDGGSWPSAEAIKNALSDPDYHLPHMEEDEVNGVMQMKIALLENRYGETLTRISDPFIMDPEITGTPPTESGRD